MEQRNLFSGFFLGVIDSVGLRNTFTAPVRSWGIWLLIGAVFLGIGICLALGHRDGNAALLAWAAVRAPRDFRNAFFYNDFPPVSASLQTTRRDYLRSVLPQHRTKPGETLYSISRYYYTSSAALAGMNQINDPRMLHAGQILSIPPVDFQNGRLQKYSLKNGETLGDIMARYDLDLWRLQRLNPFCDMKKVRPGVIINLPEKPDDGGRRVLGIHLIRPINGFLTSRFGFRWGRMHFGLDLAAPQGMPVRAAAAGRVEFAGWAGGYGRLVKINHGNFRTVYAHLSAIHVLRGNRVTRGQGIGLVGSSGHAFGSHLHFEVEKNGKRINPYTYLF